MYKITCDGLPLLDLRDSDMVLVNPKVNLEVNTVGEGSFTIYKNHPHYGSLKKLKSVFEVSDDDGVIFRGRATGDTTDFDHGMNVDLEGAMAYFNDSVVREFDFPDKFNVQGDRVEFFLKWLIDNHNSQVQDFQKVKLGMVTVKDPNFACTSYKRWSTWEILKDKLFGSSLGGYLCIRYEKDGNYIDYLSEFTETNTQEVVFGENLLDLKNSTEASETYSAIIPLGALELTIENLADREVTDDIVKSGDTLYSKKAVEEYGWIYAPTSKTTWDEVVDDAVLLTTGVEWLTGSAAKPIHAIEATAVDLHFTDKQVESLRIYKNVSVRSMPHDVAEALPLAKLEIDLLNPQNTKIRVGETISTLTERNAMQQEEVKKQYSKLTKTDDEIRLEVKDEIKKLESSFSQTVNGFTLTVRNNEDGTSSYFELKNGETVLSSGNITFDGFVTFTGLEGGTTKINGGCVQTGLLKSHDGETFVLDLDNGTFKMKGSGQFQSFDGSNYITIEGDELVMYSKYEATGEYLDKIRLGFMSGTDPSGSGDTIDYPYMLLGKASGDVGMVKKFYNGLWIGNSVPKYVSGRFEGMDGASGFFINTQTGVSYVVNGTDMKDVYAGAAGEMTLTSEDISHEGDKLADAMPVYITQAEYDARVAAGSINPDTPYFIQKEV